MRALLALAIATTLSGATLSSTAAAQGTCALIITAPSADCRLSVDGERAGASPARVTGLLPGSHLVQATCDGVSQDQIVELVAGRSEVVRFAAPSGGSAGQPADEGASEPGMLGLRLATPTASELAAARVLVRERDLHGVVVADVVAGGAAEAAGIQQGDYLSQVDGQEVRTSDDLIGAIRSRSAGDTLVLRVHRPSARTTRDVTATLAPRPVSEELGPTARERPSVDLGPSRVGEAYLTAPPAGWDGGNVFRSGTSDIVWGSALFLIGVGALAGGVHLILNEGEIGGGTLLSAAGLSAVGIGLFLFFSGLAGRNGPGRAQDSGVVFWGSLAPAPAGYAGARLVGGVNGRF